MTALETLDFFISKIECNDAINLQLFMALTDIPNKKLTAE